VTSAPGPKVTMTPILDLRGCLWRSSGTARVEKLAPFLRRDVGAESAED
jgi:hypothetical protein